MSAGALRAPADSLSEAHGRTISYVNSTECYVALDSLSRMICLPRERRPRGPGGKKTRTAREEDPSAVKPVQGE